jgi:hypothetical protein
VRGSFFYLISTSISNRKTNFDIYGAITYEKINIHRPIAKTTVRNMTRLTVLCFFKNQSEAMGKP